MLNKSTKGNYKTIKGKAMDLSVNKIKGNNLKFKGMKGAFHKDNTPILKFIAPPFDRQNETVTLQIAMLKQDKETKQYEPLEQENIMELDFEDDGTLVLSQDNVREYSRNFAYRYKITNKNNGQERYVVDGFKKIKLKDNSKMNLIEQSDNYLITPKTGPMYHSFVDSDAILDINGKPKKFDSDFVRNHFNKLGGSIKGLTYLLKNTNELENYRYIITTPDIGNDPTSSHKYWPSNQYQCSNIEDFKEFIFELYKRGKGYVADGAFTSQGIHSPMVQHVLKWGENSPFYNMLKVDGKINLGVLPDKTYDGTIEPQDYIGIRIVNSPNIKGYDSKKPIYIQFFDSRLSSDEQQNSNELIKAYDKNPSDHYDITSHQDSIIPYYFEINPNDAKRLKAFGKNKTILLKDIESLNDFLTFENFSIVEKSKASGANFWDGNRDIIKMNLSNPTNSRIDIEGYKNARDYLFGVASFWSETIQSDLILKTALMSNSERKQTAIQNDLSKEEYKELTNSLSEAKSFILEQGKTVEDYIKEFPLQSIETNPNLSAVFSEPKFNEELLSKDTFEKIQTIVNDVIDEAIPNEYKQDNDYRVYVTKLYTPTILKNIYAGALCPNAIEDDGTINQNEMKKVSLNSLNAANATTPEEERKIVIRKITNGINRETTEKIKQKMKKDLQNIDLNGFKLAESIVIQGKAGLNWRFDAAKDIGDLDSVRDKTASFKSIMDGDNQFPGVKQFWTKFISNAAKYNPSLYSIEEITDFWAFADKEDMLNKNFDEKLDAWFKSLSEEEQKIHENQMPYVKEIEFINSTGATTSSNYDAYFNNLTAYLGVDPENGYDKSHDAGNIVQLKKRMENFIASVQPNMAILSHMFFDNHDKPRILHTLPINMELFSKINMQYASEEDKKQAAPLLEGRTDYKRISAKAVAVGLLMKKNIDEIYKNDPDKKDKLTKSLINLVNGKSSASPKPNFKRAEAFGTTPYEISTRDIFKNAGYDNNEDEIIAFHYNLKKNSMHLQENLWEVMNAIMGTPSIFYGTNFGQTGYETASKNVYVQNRNQAMHELQYKDGYRGFYNKINAITELYKQPGLSALRNGFPISLKNTSAINGVHPAAVLYFREKIKEYAEKENKTFDEIIGIINSKNKNEGKQEYERFLSEDLKIDGANGNFETLESALYGLNPENPSTEKNIDLWPIFKYDEKGSKTISIITNNGITRRKQSYKANSSNKTYEVMGIPIKDNLDRCPLKEGTKVVRKIYDSKNEKFVDDKTEYVIKNGNIQSVNGDPIQLTETVETFYVPNQTNINVKYRTR